MIASGTLVKIALIFMLSQAETDKLYEYALKYDVTPEHILEMYAEDLFKEYKPYAEVTLEKETNNE